MIELDEVEEVSALPGVPIDPALLYAPLLPPSNVGPRIRDAIVDIAQTMDAIPADQDGAIIGHYSRDAWFGAVVMRVPGGFHVKAWIGQEDGHRFDYGVGVLKTFKF